MAVFFYQKYALLCVDESKNVLIMRRSLIFIKVDPMDKILNWLQACEALSISRPTLYALTNQGLLKLVKVSKGSVGWPQSEVSKYIEGLVSKADR